MTEAECLGEQPHDEAPAEGQDPSFLQVVRRRQGPADKHCTNPTEGCGKIKSQSEVFMASPGTISDNS